MDVLVVIEQQAGKIARPSWEAIAAAQRMSGDFDGRVSAVVLGRGIGSIASEAAKASLAEVLAIESPGLEEYTADGYVYALQDVIRGQRPDYVLFGHTYQARDFAPRLAAVLGCGFASDCVNYHWTGGRCVLTRQMFQGKLSADVELVGGPPYLISFQAGSFREDAVKLASASSPLKSRSMSMPVGVVRAKPGEPFRDSRQTVDLARAEIIVTAGRGIKAPENLELVKQLAESLGGEVGASRPICDSGWLPMDRQIGSSGQSVAPKLYVALGVSGAIQHQVGMKGSRTIVAINKDREAPIFEIASYGIVGDIFEVVPPLIEEIKKVKTN